MSIRDQLHAILREREGREGSPSAGVIDTQTITSAEKAGPKLKPIRLVVHSAGIQARDGAALLFHRVEKRFPWLECVFADPGYDARQTSEAAGADSLRPDVVRLNPDAGVYRGDREAPGPGADLLLVRPELIRDPAEEVGLRITSLRGA